MCSSRHILTSPGLSRGPIRIFFSVLTMASECVRSIWSYQFVGYLIDIRPSVMETILGYARFPDIFRQISSLNISWPRGRRTFRFVPTRPSWLGLKMVWVSDFSRQPVLRNYFNSPHFYCQNSKTFRASAVICEVWNFFHFFFCEFTRMLILLLHNIGCTFNVQWFAQDSSVKYDIIAFLRVVKMKNLVKISCSPGARGSPLGYLRAIFPRNDEIMHIKH